MRVKITFFLLVIALASAIYLFIRYNRVLSEMQKKPALLCGSSRFCDKTHPSILRGVCSPGGVCIN